MGLSPGRLTLGSWLHQREPLVRSRESECEREVGVSEPNLSSVVSRLWPSSARFKAKPWVEATLKRDGLRAGIT